MRSRAFLERLYANWLIVCTWLIPRRWSPRRPAERTQIIAHRGASHLAPENTLASVRLAWELDADAVEVDVHLTKDHRIVVIHDPTTERTAGVNLEVAATDSPRLRELDVGSCKHPDFAGETIPFLEEILATVPPGRHLFVEIKCGPEILPILNETIARGGKRSQVVLIGFDLATMKAAKEILPDIPVHWLCDKKIWGPSGRSLAGQAQARGLDGVNVHWSGVTWRLARVVRKARLKLYAWTVDYPRDAARLCALGVDGITTNCPGSLRRRLLPRHSPARSPATPQEPDCDREA